MLREIWHPFVLFFGGVWAAFRRLIWQYDFTRNIYVTLNDVREDVRDHWEERKEKAGRFCKRATILCCKISAVILVLTVWVALAVMFALFLYSILYYFYVPTKSHTYELFFDYSQPLPVGVINFLSPHHNWEASLVAHEAAAASQSSILASGVQYDVTIRLEFADTPAVRSGEPVMLAAELLHYQTRDVKVESPPPIMVGAAAADPVVGDVWVDAAVDEGGGSSSLEQEINDEFEERSASPLSNGNELDNEFDQILEEEMAFSGPGGEGVEEELSRSSRPRRVDVFHHHLHRHRVSPAPAKKRMAVSSVPARGEAKDRSLVDEESIISQGIWASVFRSRFAEGRRDGRWDVLGRCVRPVPLPYLAPLVAWIRDLAVLWLRVLGLWSQTVKADVLCFESFVESSGFPAGGIRVALSSHTAVALQASVVIEARYTGFRYFMYHWFLSSFAVGVALLTCLTMCMSCCTVASVLGFLYYKGMIPLKSDEDGRGRFSLHLPRRRRRSMESEAHGDRQRREKTVIIGGVARQVPRTPSMSMSEESIDIGGVIGGTPTTESSASSSGSRPRPSDAVQVHQSPPAEQLRRERATSSESSSSHELEEEYVAVEERKERRVTLRLRPVRRGAEGPPLD